MDLPPSSPRRVGLRATANLKGQELLPIWDPHLHKKTQMFLCVLAGTHGTGGPRNGFLSSGVHLESVWITDTGGNSRLKNLTTSVHSSIGAKHFVVSMVLPHVNFDCKVWWLCCKHIYTTRIDWYDIQTCIVNNQMGILLNAQGIGFALTTSYSEVHHVGITRSSELMAFGLSVFRS